MILMRIIRFFVIIYLSLRRFIDILYGKEKNISRLYI